MSFLLSIACWSWCQCYLGMKRIGGMNQANRYAIKPQRKMFNYPNPAGFFPYIMKGFEFYNPPINQMVMRHMRDDRIKHLIHQLYSPSTFKWTKCGMRFQKHSQLKEHLDYHFQQSALETERRSGPLTRKPFSTYLNWISDSNIDVTQQKNEMLTREQQELEHCETFSNCQSNCFICGEEFKTLLKDNDEYYFMNCKKIRINTVTVKVHVFNCAKVVEDQVAKYNESKLKPEMEEEEITHSTASIKK